jgi:hypothetical protein
MLAMPDMLLTEKHTARELELWRMLRGEREVRCVAVYLPLGVDLRLIENGEVQRTQLAADGLSSEHSTRFGRRSDSCVRHCV